MAGRRQEAHASAPVSQHPAVLLLAGVMGWGDERSGGGGRADESSGRGTAMLLIYLAVGEGTAPNLSWLSLSSIRWLSQPSCLFLHLISRLPSALTFSSISAWSIIFVSVISVSFVCSRLDLLGHVPPHFLFFLSLARPWRFSTLPLIPRSPFFPVYIHPSRNHAHIQALNW